MGERRGEIDHYTRRWRAREMQRDSNTEDARVAARGSRRHPGDDPGEVEENPRRRIERAGRGRRERPVGVDGDRSFAARRLDQHFRNRRRTRLRGRSCRQWSKDHCKNQRRNSHTVSRPAHVIRSQGIADRLPSPVVCGGRWRHPSDRRSTMCRPELVFVSPCADFSSGISLEIKGNGRVSPGRSVATSTRRRLPT